MIMQTARLLLTSAPFKVKGHDHCDFVMRWLTSKSWMLKVVNDAKKYPKNPFARALVITTRAMQEVEGLKKKLVARLGVCTECDAKVPEITPGCEKCQYRVGHQEPEDESDREEDDDDDRNNEIMAGQTRARTGSGAFRSGQMSQLSLTSLLIPQGIQEQYGEEAKHKASEEKRGVSGGGGGREHHGEGRQEPESSVQSKKPAARGRHRGA